MSETIYVKAKMKIRVCGQQQHDYAVSHTEEEIMKEIKARLKKKDDK